ncbi:MAG: MFS transporter [Anaerolineae bacterium]|nr:MFS transporter [Anaerolineae bacterium]
MPFLVQYWLLLSKDDLFLIMLSLFLSALVFWPLWDQPHTGQRREGIYYSPVSLLNKVGSSIAVPAASLLLGWAGYVPNQPQSIRTLWAIRSLVGPIPAVLLTAGILLAALYPLTRERHAHLREELARRQMAA